MELPLPDDGIFVNIERIFLPRWKSWIQSLLALPTKIPLQVAYYRSRDFECRLKELLIDQDGVLAHLVRTGDMVRHYNGHKFLEMTDAISLNYSRIKKFQGSKLGFRACIYSLESNRLRHYERMIVDDFDVSFLVSDIDRQFLYFDNQRKLNKVRVLSNGVDLSRLPFQFDPNGLDIAFIGNMSSFQNLDMVRFIIAEILPLVQRRFPKVNLRVIGRIHSKDAAIFSKNKSVIVTGEVPDIAVAAFGAGVGVCPMRLGAGVQNKILEYFALGLPVVTSSQGLEGIDAVCGRDLLIADNASEFSEKIIEFLSDKKFAKSLALEGRKYVENYHSWAAKLEGYVAEVTHHLEL
jgi:glycosyltransferase involved in cell wall biosynthesis